MKNRNGSGCEFLRKLEFVMNEAQNRAVQPSCITALRSEANAKFHDSLARMNEILQAVG